MRLRWDEIITRLSYRFIFLAIRDVNLLLPGATVVKPSAKQEAAGCSSGFAIGLQS